MESLIGLWMEHNCLLNGQKMQPGTREVSLDVAIGKSMHVFLQ